MQVVSRGAAAPPAMPTLHEVCAKARTLPCSPSLLPRLIRLLEQPDSDVADLAQLIQLDPVLAASTVRLANSAYFSGGATVQSVAEAVMRMGGREIYRLAALALGARWMTIEVEGYRWEAGDFCRASLVKALAAEVLAEQTGRADPALAYTCGLVHEIGKLALAHACGGDIPRIRNHQLEHGGPWLEAETAILGFNHANVSARLLEEWRFPAACIAIAAHNPPDERLLAPEHRALAAHVHAAQHLAVALGLGQGEDGFLYALNTTLLAEWGLEPAVLETAMPEVLERATKLLRTQLGAGPIAA